MIRIWNGPPDHLKTEQNGRHFELFLYFYLWKPNFEMFRFRMDAVFERSVFKPPVYILQSCQIVFSCKS